MGLPIESSYLNTIANRRNNSPIDRPSTAEVDALGTELAEYYQNPAFRVWYCMVVYKLGIQKVLELKSRADEGTHPARLFSRLASDLLKRTKDE